MRKKLSVLLVICMLLSLVLNIIGAGAAPSRADRGAWAPGVAYAVNDTVTYGGSTYKCLQAHTSITSWEPPNTPALWQLVTGGGATATRTNTLVGPTATRTNTATGPTLTPTRTPTRTNTVTGPTATRTNTPITSTNLALNKPATSSSNENTSLTPNLAVDGNTGTRWASAYSDPQWIRIDLGATVNVNRVVLRWEAAYGSAYQIQTSNDGSSWSNIFTTTTGNGATDDLTGLSGSGRYIRMNGTTRATAWGYSLFEFEVYGTSGPTITPGGPTATRTNTPVGPTATRTNTPTPNGTATCAVKSAPTGKVLQGYWEAWDGSSVHPGMGHISLAQVPAAYNVINLAFPVILSDGTAQWFDGMDTGVDVPTPAEVCAVKAAGHWVLLSIGGATAAVDLSQTATVDRFISTIVPILKTNNFDGIDIDLESGLVAGASYTQLSTSQSNLIRLIDGVLAQMPSNFMLTMAPETAYVTGGQIAFGGPWGAYLPIIGRYRDNGRLSWLNMQYYNGNMYGCPAVSYSAGTVQGFVEQTRCLNNGMQMAGGGTFSLPYSKQVPGLPAQPGAGGGYMSPSLVSQAYSQVSGIKGLMTWSINWDGSQGYTFANTKPY